MAILLFFSWWYGAGWKNSFARIMQRVDVIASELSMSILLSTLFEPWKQIKTYSGPDTAFDLKIHALIDNIFARCFGFVIRSTVLVCGVIACVFALVLGTLLAICWPLVPLIPLVCIVLTVVLR